MAASIVNGYFCTSPCDVAKARKGVDPHPAANAAKQDGGKSPDEAGALGDQPAVIFGGSLAELSAASPPSASREAGDRANDLNSSGRIDRLA